MKCAPIALFVYKRLWHTQQAIKSLLKNDLAKSSDLYIFSDGARDKQSEIEVMQLRDWLDSINGFKNVHIIKRDNNLGLSRSIISGVTELVNTFEKIIVLEDDLVLSPHFLTFMNDGLIMYEKDEQVASIHGYALPLKEQLPTCYFLRGADCWGWATWKRAWNKFESEGIKLVAQLKKQNLIKKFNYNNAQKNFEMLKNQIDGKNDSWAIRWHASAFLNDMFTLYPSKSLVKNIGFDNTGEHCVSSTSFDVHLHLDPIPLQKIVIQEDQKAFDAYSKYFSSLHMPILAKILRKFKKHFYKKTS